MATTICLLDNTYYELHVEDKFLMKNDLYPLVILFEEFLHISIREITHLTLLENWFLTFILSKNLCLFTVKKPIS